VGSVITAAKVYSRRDVDELVLLDVTARQNNRTVSPLIVAKLAEFLRVPFSVGGGISSLKEIESLLSSGADKVIIGTNALLNMKLISDAATSFGSQAIVVSLDVASSSSGTLAVNSGKNIIDISLVDAAKSIEQTGAGEILFQSIERDGLQCGMDLFSMSEISPIVTIPIIASGGAGSYEHLLEGLKSGATAVPAGAMFQFTEHTPKGARDFLRSHGVEVRANA
jgi:cyclase